mgnify:CR=1 FL=1
MSFLEKLFNISNKRIVVTGAGRGNGKAISLGLSKLKCNLIICDNDKQSLNLTYKLIKKNNPNCKKFLFNLGNVDEINNFIVSLKEKKIKIDVLINNAGISLPSNSIEYPLDKWEETFKVNLRAPFILSTRIAKIMRKNNSSSIINITSLGAHLGFSNNISYISSKGALKQMTKSLAYDLSDSKIRVNSICPGYIKTNMTKKSQKNKHLSNKRINSTLLKRWGKSEDLLGAIVYLSSDASSYVTGTEIVVDGGWLAKGL